MFDEFSQYGLEEPELIDMDGDFRVNFYRNNESQNVTKNENGTKNGIKNGIKELPEKEFLGKQLARIEKILEVIEENKKASKQIIAEQIGSSARTISRDMDKLRELGIIERVGSRSAGYWKVNE